MNSISRGNKVTDRNRTFEMKLVPSLVAPSLVAVLVAMATIVRVKVGLYHVTVTKETMQETQPYQTCQNSLRQGSRQILCR